MDPKAPQRPAEQDYEPVSTPPAAEVPPAFLAPFASVGLEQIRDPHC